jgi:uncharacterized Zn-binding protein involved in type VI secretion
VFFDGLAAARKDDTCTCGSALASAVSSTVFINGRNAALVGTVRKKWGRIYLPLKTNKSVPFSVRTPQTIYWTG